MGYVSHNYIGHHDQLGPTGDTADYLLPKKRNRVLRPICTTSILPRGGSINVLLHIE